MKFKEYTINLCMKLKIKTYLNTKHDNLKKLCIYPASRRAQLQLAPAGKKVERMITWYVYSSPKSTDSRVVQVLGRRRLFRHPRSIRLNCDRFKR